MTDRDSRLRVLRETAYLSPGRRGRRKSATDRALDIRVQHEPGHVVVTVAGEIDIATVGRLGEELSVLAASGWPLVADLDQVSFIDAAGLRALGAAAGQAAAHGASLHVVCDRRHTRRLFRLTGLDRRLLLARNLAEAVQALAELGEPARKQRPDPDP